MITMLTKERERVTTRWRKVGRTTPSLDELQPSLFEASSAWTPRSVIPNPERRQPRIQSSVDTEGRGPARGKKGKKRKNRSNISFIDMMIWGNRKLFDSPGSGREGHRGSRWEERREALHNSRWLNKVQAVKQVKLKVIQCFSCYTFLNS